MKLSISGRLLALALCVLISYAGSALAVTNPEGGANPMAVIANRLREMKVVPDPATAMLVALGVGILLLFRKLLLRRWKSFRSR